MNNNKGKKVDKSNNNSTSNLNLNQNYIARSGQSTSDFVNEFWQHTITQAENSEDDYKKQSLPLARIKKVMRNDPNVQMISSEVTIMFEKACQIFIQEVTARSHLNSLTTGRRTLSRPDIASAISKSDVFDFLIDIVPREESDPISVNGKKSSNSSSTVRKNGKKNGRGKGKKNKKSLEESEDEFGSDVIGGSGGNNNNSNSRRKRSKIDEVIEEPNVGEVMEEIIDESTLHLGLEPVVPALSSFTSGEAIDWTANDFKIGN